MPATVVGIIMEVFLQPRHDYVGHFLAGYGATLVACIVGLRGPRGGRLAASSEVTVLLMTLACVAIGAMAEATFFRIAKFDEIDFCSQSLGATLAGIAAVAYVSPKTPAFDFDWAIVIGIMLLGAGGCFAVA